VGFGDYTFDLATGELWRGSQEVKLTPRTAALLGALAERPMQVVTKQELIERVWEGKAVGDDALTSSMQELRRALGDDPRHPRFVETRHRRGYRLLVSTADGSPKDTTLSPPLPDKPSIAVLPFQNLSGDPQQEYFVDGLVEDITTALSRVRWLFVIARNSSFTYKGNGQSVDIKRVGRELGVRYLLDGSVRRSDTQVRIIGRLIETSSGGTLWSDRFDGCAADIFGLQDRLTESIVGVLTPNLERAEIQRVRRKPTANMDAYDCYLRAVAGIHAWSRASIDEALSLCVRATELDPDFALGYGTAGRCYSIRKGAGWGSDLRKEAADAERMARGAWAADPSDAAAICSAAHALAYVALDLDGGAAYIERALTSNPNYAPSWYCSGWINLWLGRVDVVVDHAARAMRLSPRDPNLPSIRGMIAHAHYFAGRYDEALSWAKRALQEPPIGRHQILRIGAASAAMAGHADVAATLRLKLSQENPALRASAVTGVLGPYRDPEHLARYAEGLRKAGLPE